MTEADKTEYYIPSERSSSLNEYYSDIYSYRNCCQCIEKMGFSIDGGRWGYFKSPDMIYAITAYKTDSNFESELFVVNRQDAYMDRSYLIVKSKVSFHSQDSSQESSIAQQLVNDFFQEILGN